MKRIISRVCSSGTPDLAGRQRLQDRFEHDLIELPLAPGQIHLLEAFFAMKGHSEFAVTLAHASQAGHPAIRPGADDDLAIGVARGADPRRSQCP